MREYTIHGCVCYLSEKTIKAFEDEQRAIAEERERWEDMHKMYLQACKSNDPIDWSIYSDLYKDCYGCRPRH